MDPVCTVIFLNRGQVVYEGRILRRGWSCIKKVIAVQLCSWIYPSVTGVSICFERQHMRIQAGVRCLKAIKCKLVSALVGEIRLCPQGVPVRDGRYHGRAGWGGRWRALHVKVPTMRTW